MVKVTREQRDALKRTFRRATLYANKKGNLFMPTTQPQNDGDKPMTYRDFRRQAYPTFGCDGAVAVPWCGMWLCVERDGYIHS